MTSLFNLIWSQTVVAYFQNWPYYNNYVVWSWILCFVLIPALLLCLFELLFIAWTSNHHKKYLVNKDTEPEKELPKVPEGLFTFPIKENSRFVKEYLKEFKRYPRSLCDYAPHCAGLTAIAGSSGLFILGVLVLFSNILFYWLWVGLWKTLLATPWMVTVIFPSFALWLATSLFTGVTEAIGYAADSSAVAKIAVFVVIFGLTVLFLKSQAGKATRLWAYSKAKKMCIPLRIIPAKK